MTANIKRLFGRRLLYHEIPATLELAEQLLEDIAQGVRLGDFSVSPMTISGNLCLGMPQNPHFLR
jgi:hypothetical protein